MSAMSCNDFNCSRLQPHDLPVRHTPIERFISIYCLALWFLISMLRYLFVFFVCVGMNFSTVVEQSTVKDNRVTLVLCGGLLQVVYRGKQLHHLVYKRKAKQVEDFSNCEQMI